MPPDLAPSPIADGVDPSTPAAPPKKPKKAKKPKAPKEPKAPRAPRAPSAPRFSLRAFIDARKVETGKPVDLALSALGDAFAAEMRATFGGKPVDLADLDAKIVAAEAKVAAMRAERLAASTRDDGKANLLARLDAAAETLAGLATPLLSSPASSSVTPS